MILGIQGSQNDKPGQFIITVFLVFFLFFLFLFCFFLYFALNITCAHFQLLEPAGPV